MSTYPYLAVLGTTSNTVIGLPGPNGDIQVNGSRSETVHTLIGGGTTVTRRRATKKNYSLAYSSRPYTGIDDLLWAIYRGMYGDGPFVFCDPSANNVLTIDQSTFGLRAGTSYGWSGSGGSTAITTSVAAPTGVQSGVLQWSSPTVSSLVLPGSLGSTADVSTASPVLPAEPATFSVYLKASGSCTCSLALWNHNASTGAAIGSLGSGSASVTTSWQRFTLSIAAGASGALLVPRVTLTASTPSSIYLAAAQLEYNSAASLFTPGYGSPRVLVTAPPDKAITKWGWSDLTLTLAEV